MSAAVLGQGLHVVGGWSTETNINNNNFRLLCSSAATPEINGRVTYENAAVPVVPVPSANLNAAGAPAVMTTSNTSGNYSITGLGPGAYTVTPSKATQPFTTPNGIFSNDAALISRHVVGLQTLNATQLKAAMVGGGPTLSSFDAGLLAQYIVGIPNVNNQTGQWKFTPANRMYASVTSTQTNQDYAGLLMGDVSGDWAPPAGRPFTSVDSEFFVWDAAAVSLPDITAWAGKPVTVPVRLDNLMGEAVSSYQFTIQFDQTVIAPAEIAASLAGTMADGMNIVCHSPKPGVVSVAVYSAFPVTGDGIYVDLNFRVTGKSGSTTTLSVEGFRFNEGTHKVVATGGNVSVR
jgi:hypothetical protein